ncbi:MAG: MoxR family ATPase [Thermoguttaceae bacterium]|jgi:MoxR-like ATPase
MNAQTPAAASDVAAVDGLRKAYHSLCCEMGKLIVGQQRVVEEALICILTRSHAILEGVPGLAKTLLVSTLAKCMRLEFSRIQFTPDLMPSDITGTEVIQENKATGERSFRFLRGPIFANVILADEINRTPPKTQAALLESMQERQVTAGGSRHPMLTPFFVLATQNPIEQEGTYPLPEAQQDRFMFKILVDYPSWEEEKRVIFQTTADEEGEVTAILDRDQILALQHVVRRIPVSEHVVDYVLRLVRATRVNQADAPQFVRDHVSWGAGPRACQCLVLAGKAHAAIHGRYHVATDDITAVAKPALRHRIVMNFNADAEGFSADRLVERLIETIPAKESGITQDPQAKELVRA